MNNILLKPPSAKDRDCPAPNVEPHRLRKNFASLLASAMTFLARGDNMAALAAASEACWCAPDLPEPHYAYGTVLAELGDSACAEQAFARAIQLKPSWADAWVSYGVSLYRQSRIEDATIAMRNALVADRSNSAAASNLSAFLLISGEADEAERLLKDLIARDPENVGARLNLVASLLQEERPQEALVLLQAISVAKSHTATQAWRLSQSLAMLQLNRLHDARALLTEIGVLPPELEPLRRWRLVLIACAERDFERARMEAEDMETALDSAGPGATPEHIIMAHYDLAKFWSIQNAPLRAMARWTEGHRMLARFQPFSREPHRVFVDMCTAEFSSDRLCLGPRANNTDPAPVFVVGMPRSGTTLIEQILAAHCDVHAAGERGALSKIFYALGGDVNERSVKNIAALDHQTLNAAAEKYLAEMHALAPQKARIVDKMPGNFLYLGLVALMLPAAKIIHCQRDPRDVGFSIFTYRFYGKHNYAHSLADLGWYIGEHDRLMSHWKAVLQSQILSVKLSDWVENFDGTLARVLDFLSLPPDENCAKFYEGQSRVRTMSYAQVRKPINAKGLGRWRPYEASLAPLIEELQRAGCLAEWN